MAVDYLTDSAAIQVELSLSSTIGDKCELRRALAKLTLIAWKGQTWYDARFAEKTPGTAEAFLKAREAESWICYHFALPHLNTILEDAGGILSVTWTESAGIKTEKRTASPGIVKFIKSEVLTAARCLVDADVVVEYADDTAQTGILMLEGFSPVSSIVLSALLNENEV